MIVETEWKWNAVSMKTPRPRFLGDEILKLIDANLIPTSSSGECKVFYS